jgi:predicted PurR-regulated permease PerM
MHVQLPPSSPWYQHHLWQIEPVRDLLWIGLFAAVLGLGYYLRSIFTPVLIALFLAYIFDPLLTWAHRRLHMHRAVGAAVLVVMIVVVGLLLALWLGPMFTQQLVGLAKATPRYLNNIAARYNIELGEFRTDAQGWAESLQKDPTGAVMRGVTVVLAGTTQAVTVINTVLGTTTYVLMVLLMVPLCFFFFAWEFDRIKARLTPFIPASRRERTLELIHRMDQTVAMFFRSRLVIGLVMGAMLSIAWAFVGVPYWFLVGMGTGIISVVPYAQTIGWPVAVLLKWLEASSGSSTAAVDLYAVLLWPTVAFFGAQTVEAFVLTPLIQGHALKLSIVTVLLAVLVGGALGGLYGLLLAIPITACCKIILVEELAPKLRAWAAAS